VKKKPGTGHELQWISSWDFVSNVFYLYLYKTNRPPLWRWAMSIFRVNLILAVFAQRREAGYHDRH
jgi:hypothetical protein